MFEYRKYWEQIGTTMKDKFSESEISRLQQERIVDILKDFEFESILELGAGFGRITRNILDNFKVKHYTCLDVSLTQINHLHKDFPNVEAVYSSIKDFNTKEQWDLVIASEVLMHIVPENIDYVFYKMSKWAKTAILSLDYYPIESCRFEKLDPHNWEYDYQKKYREIVFGTDEFRISPLQSIFFCIRSPN